MKSLSQWQVIIGVLIPFMGTTLGSAFVFLLKKEIKGKASLMASLSLYIIVSSRTIV